MEKVKIGVIGCGNISEVYFRNLQRFSFFEIAACSDLIREKAEDRAIQFGIPKVINVDQLLADPEIEIVLNLTVPQAHAEVARAALEQGKHVYNEKPLTINLAEAKEILDMAEKKQLLVGCAPDTFLGGALQTCRKLIDDGWIGRPIAATAFRIGWGPEDWHPDPEFFYKNGAGPMFDMGPYYLTALVSLLGPVDQVTAITQVSYPERIITSQPKYGRKINVEVPTHVAGIMNFKSQAIATIVTSFDLRGSQLPHIEIYGTNGTLSIPDPNCFNGAVRLQRAGSDKWDELPLLFGYTENYRGLGLADMACALRQGRPPRASGVMAYHVLEVMHAFFEAAKQARHIKIQSNCGWPAPLPLGLFENSVIE